MGLRTALPDVLVHSVRHFPGSFFDLGTNTGLHSLAATAARPDVSVHAFEAFPPLAAMLAKNHAPQGSARRLRVVGKAVAEKEGTLTLYVPRPTGAVETICSLDPDFKEDITEEVKVQPPLSTSPRRSRAGPQLARSRSTPQAQNTGCLWVRAR